eukprot:scaffold648427_cov29-Prasinocladus_malaysianus.AAC.1
MPSKVKSKILMHPWIAGSTYKLYFFDFNQTTKQNKPKRPGNCMRHTAKEGAEGTAPTRHAGNVVAQTQSAAHKR